MTVNIAGKTVGVGAIIAAIGGLLAVVGTPLAWLTMTAQGTSESINGLDADLLGGKLAALLGIVIIAVVVAGILNVKIPQSSAILAVLGVLLLLVVVLVYFTSILGKASFKDTMDLASGFGGSASLGIGYILEAVGGILAIVGGGMGLMKKSA
jgi:uncharacterized membrane protein